MSEYWQPLTIPELVPTLESDLFIGHEHARFAVGQIGNGHDTLYPQEKLAYHQLRANVYARQTGMLPLDRVHEDGGEYDEDDARSIHLAILENGGEMKRPVASMRLITRGSDLPLPIEEFFPGVFASHPAPDTSCEVSRYIVRHEDKDIQDSLRWPLFQQGLAEAVRHQLGPVFAVVEPGLSRIFRLKRLPVTELAEPVWIAEYNEFNLPIVIDVEKLAQQLERRSPGAIAAMMADENSFVYFGERGERPGASASERHVEKVA